MSIGFLPYTSPNLSIVIDPTAYPPKYIDPNSPMLIFDEHIKPKLVTQFDKVSIDPEFGLNNNDCELSQAVE